ncbi:leucine-rich repeat-containing protein 25 [Aptenodytes patagonicus]|uniref:leucine-rich repeat-containing protein 25 n=1 Tax=Aptenodytes patagonicus TaxID=9234 RepID=UPI003F9FDCD8
MGHPAAPLTLLLLLLCPAASTAPCFAVPPDAPAELDLTNSSHQCAELDLGPFQRQSRLWLSRNGIDALSPSSRVGPRLQELDLSQNRLRELPAAFLSQARGLRHLQLQQNRLQELPDDFFANAVALQSLRLEDNPLPAVPPTAFRASLRLLAVTCRCDVVGSILAPCTCSRPNCTVPRCHCLTSHHDVFNATDFHVRECWGSTRLVAGLAGATVGVAVLLAVTAVVCYRQRKVATAAASAGWGKRESTAAHGQPRYISRAAEIGTTDAAAAPDYENVFVSPCTGPAAARGWTPGWQEERYSPQVPVDDNYFLESEAVPGDQPIYANTRCSGEDIYVIPDQ